MQLDAVQQIAWFAEAKNRYEIRCISSVEKNAMTVDLDNMTSITMLSGTKSAVRCFLLVPHDPSFGDKWYGFKSIVVHLGKWLS